MIIKVHISYDFFDIFFAFDGDDVGVKAIFCKIDIFHGLEIATQEGKACSVTHGYLHFEAPFVGAEATASGSIELCIKSDILDIGRGVLFFRLVLSVIDRDASVVIQEIFWSERKCSCGWNDEDKKDEKENT